MDDFISSVNNVSNINKGNTDGTIVVSIKHK